LPITGQGEPTIPVTAPGEAQYVPLDWADLEPSALDPGEMVPQAYNEGYNAYVGDPVAAMIPDETLPWDAAWQELAPARPAAGSPNSLGRSVISLYLP
jgi:hypothetical protein